MGQQIVYFYCIYIYALKENENRVHKMLIEISGEVRVSIKNPIDSGWPRLLWEIDRWNCRIQRHHNAPFSIPSDHSCLGKLTVVSGDPGDPSVSIHW